MTTLLLVRHATTAATGARLGGRTAGVSLDDAGRAQAEATARRLAPLPVKAVYTSPLERTRETAEIVAAPHRRRVRDCEGVVEVEYGTWTNRPLKEVARRKLWPVVQARPSLVRFPQGESIRGMQLRAVDALQELVARHRRDAIAVVSHADVIKAAVAFYLGLPIDLFQRLHVSPASVTVLRLGEHEQPALLRFNDDGPLEADKLAPAGGRGGR
ncbi:histidine phosphatase family protein [soil metagenome]